MAKVFEKTKMLTDVPFHYCPGCTHGIAHRLVAEVLEELGAEGHCIGIASVGCSVFSYNYFNCDMIQASHGRAPAVATGAKRANPNNVVFAYQGDGDLASIGMAEIVHAATRGEKITVIFINNAIYGMTGGQMAPTTLEGMKTATTPYGRRIDLNGYPLNISELLAKLDGTCYVTRQSVDTPAAVKKAKKAIAQAFANSMAGRGTSVVEILGTCASGWKMSPHDANLWMREHMGEHYQLGDLKNEVKQ